MDASTNTFPPAERYGLQGQLRRSAVSVVANIVEGPSRELLYLTSLAQRLEFMDSVAAAKVEALGGRAAAAIHALRASLR